MSLEVILHNITGTCGEGPHWDDTTQTLLFVDIDDGELHRWNSITGQHEVKKLDTTACLIVPCRKGGYIVGAGRKLMKYDWDTGKATTLHEVETNNPKNRFNDGKCDPRGTMGHEASPSEVELEKGSLYCLGLDGSLTNHLSRLSISNGLAWSADNKTMFFIDSIPRKVYAFDYDIETGKIGKQLRMLDIPAKRVTSWGGKNFDELYVTCAKIGASGGELEVYPETGSVFRFTGLGVKGVPAPIYEG